MYVGGGGCGGGCGSVVAVSGRDAAESIGIEESFGGSAAPEKPISVRLSLKLLVFSGGGGGGAVSS